MNRLLQRIAGDRQGSSTVEFAIVVPILVSLIWGVFQLALVFEANAGMINALARGARTATIYPTPADSVIQSDITSGKFGLANGTWGTPTITTDATAGTKTITVSYAQPLSFLFFNGPNVTLTKSKVVHLST